MHSYCSARTELQHKNLSVWKCPDYEDYINLSALNIVNCYAYLHERASHLDRILLFKRQGYGLIMFLGLFQASRKEAAKAKAACKRKDKKIADLEAALEAAVQAAEKGTNVKSKPVVRPRHAFVMLPYNVLILVLHAIRVTPMPS